MKVKDIETPALLIDLNLLEKNIRTMQEKIREKRCGYRPHVKAHKSAFVAHKQLACGALGVTCQTIDEAEAMALSGVDDILLTNMVVNESKIRKVLNILGHSKIAVTVDNMENVNALALEAERFGRVLDVVVEINVGQNRTGVSSSKEALRLAEEISGVKKSSLHFKGLMGYEGHLQCSIPSFEERKKKCNEALSRLVDTKSMIEEAHIPVEIVTAGGTGTYNIASEVKGITEIQPGSYVTMDNQYRLIDTCGKDFGCSLSVLSTVVSKPVKGRAVVDLGWKSVGLEYQIFGWQGMPVAKFLPDAVYSPGGDEHGILTLNGEGSEPQLGQKVEFIPSHCDTTLNLHSQFYGIREDEVELVCPVTRH